jgi:hypothetical protein
MTKILETAKIGTETGWIDVYTGNKRVKTYVYKNQDHKTALLNQLNRVLGL